MGGGLGLSRNEVRSVGWQGGGMGMARGVFGREFQDQRAEILGRHPTSARPVAVDQHGDVAVRGLAEQDHDITLDVASVVWRHDGNAAVARLDDLDAVTVDAVSDRILQQPRGGGDAHRDPLHHDCIIRESARYALPQVR